VVRVCKYNNDNDNEALLGPLRKVHHIACMCRWWWVVGGSK